MITYVLPWRWENGIRGSCLIRIVGIDFSNTLYEEFRVGYVHRQCPDLGNTLGLINLVLFLKMWLVKMVTQDSASLRKWGIRKLERQGSLAARWHFRSKPLDPMFLSTSWRICHLVQPQAWWFKWRISCQVLIHALEGREDLLGATCPYRASLSDSAQSPVSFLPIAFPTYSIPYWSFPSLNFSHATFGGSKGEGAHLFILAVLLIYAM